MRNLLILTETPFRQRDYDRFGIATMSHHFRVAILDCTPFLRPEFWDKFSHVRFECTGYTPVRTLSEFMRVVSAFRDAGIAIDYLFSGKIRDELRSILRRNGILRTTVMAGIIPTGLLSHGQGVKPFLRRSRDLALRSYCSFCSSLSPLIPLPDFLADISISGGLQALSLVKSRTPFRIYAHSFDYDIYLEKNRENNKSNLNYAVFLDQDLVGHSDRLITGTQQFVSKDEYFNSLNRFFSYFEDWAGIPVIIAAQPKSIYEDNHPFRSREVVVGDTAGLVKNSSVVFAHYSTSISFAVLWEKPICLLTTNELAKTWIQSYWIDAFQRELNAPLINVDTRSTKDTRISLDVEINNVAYARYKEKYIKVPGTQERPLWEIFSHAIQDGGF